MNIVFVNVADLKCPSDSQGRTYRQINAAKSHSFPVGSLVEFIQNVEDDSFDGVRAYVVYHGRDCDGTPLYYLSINRYDTERQRDGFRNASWQGGFSEESLRVVAEEKQ